MILFLFTWTQATSTNLANDEHMSPAPKIRGILLDNIIIVPYFLYLNYILLYYYHINFQSISNLYRQNFLYLSRFFKLNYRYVYFF